MINPRFLSFLFLGKLFVLFNYCTANQTSNIIDHLFPTYAMTKASFLLNSTTCGKEMKDLRDAVDKRLLWSLRVIDSSGHPMPGFMYGNNYWLGRRSQCEEANIKISLPLSEKILKNNSKYRQLEKEFPPYELKYFVAYVRHNSTLQYHIEYTNEDLIILGICLPASCSSSQLSILLENVFRNRSLIVGGLYSADFRLEEIKDLIDDYDWLSSGTFISIILLLILTCLFMVIGSIYEAVLYQKHFKRHSTCAGNNVRMEENPEDKLKTSKSKDYVGKIFLAFSIFSNTKTIFNMETKSNNLPVLDGLRFFSSLCIIAVHTFYNSLDFADNKILFSRELDIFIFQAMANAGLAVDTFFFLGGFLLVFVNLTSENSSDKARPFSYVAKAYSLFLDILKRFIRITPAYMTALGLFAIYSMKLSKTSELYISDRPYELCPKYWWRNILYIHNLFGKENMCMIWTWYLSNDMQYFIIGSFLLTLSSMCFNVAVGILSFLLIASTIVSGYLSYIYEYVPTLDGQYSHVNVLYFPPWTRIGPYIVGMITSYVVIRLDSELRWKKKTVRFFWILAGSCNILVLFGLWKKQIHIIAAAFYVALSRTVWAVGLAWIVTACSTNHGGIVNQILSFKYWMPLSRLNYCVYLIHPIIIIFTNVLSGTSVHYDWIQLVSSLLACTAISYVCAYIFSLMFELPYIHLTKQIFIYLRNDVGSKVSVSSCVTSKRNVKREMGTETTNL